MEESITNMIALAALLLWPVIPLFWIPLHSFPRFFRRLGLLTYVFPLITWLPIAFLIFQERHFLLAHQIAPPSGLRLIGALLFLAGAGLQTWTLMLLSPTVITGMPEVLSSLPGKLVTGGPFSVQRHPTYLSHTLMLLGLFLWTGVTALGIATVVDALVANLALIPLEERELAERFGKEYEEYCKKVPSKFLPLPRSR